MKVFGNEREKCFGSNVKYNNNNVTNGGIFADYFEEEKENYAIDHNLTIPNKPIRK